MSPKCQCQDWAKEDNYGVEKKRRGSGNDGEGAAEKVVWGRRWILYFLLYNFNNLKFKV